MTRVGTKITIIFVKQAVPSSYDCNDPIIRAFVPTHTVLWWTLPTNLIVRGAVKRQR